MIAIIDMPKKTTSHPNSREPGRFATDFYNKLFCKNLRRRREQMGLSLFDLGELLGIDRTRISQIESGQSSVTITTISELCTALQIHPALLFSINPDESEFNDGIEIRKWPSR